MNIEMNPPGVMFVVNYIPSTASVGVKQCPEGIQIAGGKWQVDTDEDGDLAVYYDLETAFNRVKHIREIGGEACLSVVIE